MYTRSGLSIHNTSKLWKVAKFEPDSLSVFAAIDLLASSLLSANLKNNRLSDLDQFCGVIQPLFPEKNA